ncbi:MAG: hypothetical protein RLZZ231_1317 [Bacteroidota bacterium]|jgi:hypothetical protein
MKQLFLLLILLFILQGCKKAPIAANSSQPMLQTKEKSGTALKTDTLYFSYPSDDKPQDDFAIIKLMDEKFTKDSMCTSKFRIEFIQKKRILFSDWITIKGIVKGSEWYGSNEMDSINSPYKRLSFGYPACGYSQDNYLYYIEGSSSSKVHTWLSVGDGGWFNDVAFFPLSTTTFACRTASFWPEEVAPENQETDEEFGILEHSDSIVFSLQNNTWHKSFKTPKGKVYRKKRMSYDSIIN